MARNLAITKLKEYIEDEEICKKIEDSIYQYTMDKAKERCIKQGMDDIYFRRIYVNKLHQIYTNLNPESYVKNTYFLDRIVSEEFDLSKIAYLSPSELNYEAWKDMLSKQKAGEEFIETGGGLGTDTDEYTCSRCKGNDCYYHQMQQRSCDEGYTLVIYCRSCKKKWKINQ